MVVKVLGRSHGHGVFKASSPTELAERLVVIGDKVVSTIKYIQPTDDFRTNAVDSPTVEPIEVDNSMKKVVIEAVRVNGCEFGGVDILRCPSGEFYLAELNYPCNFARNQLVALLRNIISLSIVFCRPF